MLRPITPVLIGLLIGFSAASLGAAQSVSPEPEQQVSVPAPDEPWQSLSAADLQQRISDLESLDPQAEPNRDQLLQFYRDALADLHAADASIAAATEYRALIDQAPSRLQSVRDELGRPPAEPQLNITADSTLAEIEQELAQAQAELAAALQRSEELTQEVASRQQRSTKIAEEIAAARQRIRTINESLGSAESAASTDPLKSARRIRLLAELKAQTKRVDELQLEARSYDARKELLPARRDRALRQVGDLEKELEAWQKAAADKRQREAEQAARQARRKLRDAAQQSEPIMEIARDIEQITSVRSGADGLAASLGSARTLLVTRKQRLQQLRDQFTALSRKVDAVGLNSAIALQLRRQLDILTKERGLSWTVDQREKTLANAQFDLIQLEEQRDELADIEAQVRNVVAEIPESERNDETESVVRDLLVSKRDQIDQVLGDMRTYVEILTELNRVDREIIKVTDAFTDFIRERILWVRSISSSDMLSRFQYVDDAAVWLFTSPGWTNVSRNRILFREGRWFETAGIYLGIGLLLAIGPFLKKRLRLIAEQTRRFTQDHFRLTLNATGLTALLALRLPLLFYIIGSLLRLPEDQSAVGYAASDGFIGVATFLLIFESLRHVIRPNGLADAHFRWKSANLASIRRHLRWFIPVSVPLVFISDAMNGQQEELWNDSLGRLAFILFMVAQIVFVWRILSPRSPVIADYLNRYKGSWIDRTRRLWFALAIGIPASLAILAFVGYYYTAYQLVAQMLRTAALALVLLVANALLLRWLFLARRQLAIQRARAKREAQRSDAPADGGEPAPPIDESTLDIPAIDSQTRRLFSSLMAVAAVIGMLAIWSDVLPAFRMLDRVQVWPQLRYTEAAPDVLPGGTAPDAAAEAPQPDGSAGSSSSNGSSLTIPGMPTSQSQPQETQPATGGTDSRPITLLNLGLGLLLFVLTLIAARNVPGLLEIAFLQRLPIDAGARYAVSTIARYLLLLVGLSFALGALGIGWSKYQWLAAALTFGLAFGLQEIFANFVSGIIILLERPVRVGDTVTVAGVDGTITRVRMRATTITDWDRKEVIIPNKSFITDQIINWTLSDPMIRVRLPVGVAYGTDPELTTNLLMEVANEADIVHDDPKPRAIFLGFGDNCLNFELRVFIKNMDYFLSTKHALCIAITKKFNQHGIVIAFPQRDVHLDLAEPVKIQMINASPEPESAG